MTAIHNWFIMCSLDEDSDDTVEVARLTAVGNDLIAIADVHLSLLTNTVKPAGPAVPPAEDTSYYLSWITLTAQMAAELYFRGGVHGLTEKVTLAVTEKYSMNYSPMLMRMINARKKLVVMS
jgi:hypothetical protein